MGGIDLRTVCRVGLNVLSLQTPKCCCVSLASVLGLAIPSPAPPRLGPPAFFRGDVARRGPRGPTVRRKGGCRTRS